MTQRRNRPDDWTAATREEVSALFGVQPRQVSAYIARGCPGRSGRYPLPAMLAWLREHIWKARPIPDDELMDSAEDSPGLERYRLARAGQEEIKLLAMQRSYLPLDDVHTFLMDMAGIVRAAGDRCQRLGLNEAYDIINDAVDELEQRVQRRFEEYTHE